MKILYVTSLLCLLLWSGIHPHDRLTWFLEIFPAMIGYLVLALTYKKFRFTSVVYVLILLHATILMIGGHYTYAEVPLFDTLSQIMGWSRNNFDKLGHFFQGFVPAMIARELLIRLNVLNRKRWLAFFVLCICLSISAFYELLEWGSAVSLGDSADAFLGTQGYVWDTQSDMGFALLGAVLALILLSRYHDRQIQKM